MADRFKLAAGLRNLPASAREDLAGREQDIQRGKTVELLRRAGKEMYENPIVNTAVGLSPVLGDIQAGVEAYRSAQAGDWGNAGLNAVGMLPFIPMLGKTVWHGSPHTFDKFDLSKIGTGEGAQAYGHGLYLADAPEVAKQYSGETIKYQPTLEKFTNGPNYYIDEAGNYMKHRDYVKNDVPVKVSKKEYMKKWNEVQDVLASQPKGNIYKVDLPDEQIAKMLDWDKPFSEQPQNVQDAITKYWQENRVYGDPTKLTGEGIYGSVQGHVLGNRGSDIANRSASQEAASMDLNYVGIPGIQYLDQASRGAGEGTRNYVVFSDEIPQILERNNQPVGMFK